jgi:hypothetical protein
LQNSKPKFSCRCATKLGAVESRGYGMDIGWICIADKLAATVGIRQA